MVRWFGCIKVRTKVVQQRPNKNTNGVFSKFHGAYTNQIYHSSIFPTKHSTEKKGLFLIKTTLQFAMFLEYEKFFTSEEYASM